jgi:hypothetical protein
MFDKAMELGNKIALHLQSSLQNIVMTFLVRECYGSPKKQEFKKNL